MRIEIILIEQKIIIYEKLINFVEVKISNRKNSTEKISLLLCYFIGLSFIVI